MPREEGQAKAGLKAKLRDLNQVRRQIEDAIGTDTHEIDASRKRQQRAEERDIRIPRIKDPARRREALTDPYFFMQTYFPRIFRQPFTSDRKEMIDAIMHAGRYGGDQAVAGPRGDGKTRSALFGTLNLALAGHVSFPIIISKSGPRAKRELKSLKDAIESSVTLAEDFPEVVVPVLKLARWSSRARQQTAYGQLTNMEWGDEVIAFPTLSTELLRSNGWNEDFESAARGQIIASLGVEGPIRGYSVRNERPDVAILDDLDDRESARSQLQTDYREQIIEEDIGGLGGPDQTISRVMLCTLINLTCTAATYTDRSRKPSWRGQRHKWLLKYPSDMKLWEAYIELRQGRSPEDPDARVAHRFYIDNREAMEAGAEVTNPYRFDSRPLSDGGSSELSALQSAFNIIADRGQAHFDTEYQNDPPKEAEVVASGLTATDVMKKLSGHKRYIVPRNCIHLSCGVDVGKFYLHWVVRAWRLDGTGFTIDYGVKSVYGTQRNVGEGVDEAIHTSLRALLSELEEKTEYIDETGELMQIGMTLIDSKWHPAPVRRFCVEQGKRTRPSMGFGKSSGAVDTKFTEVYRTDRDRRPGGFGWFRSRKKIDQHYVEQINLDADYWKSWEHDHWLTSIEKPGSLSLFGEPGDDQRHISGDEKDHKEYAKHICSESVATRTNKNGETETFWPKPKGENHWLDASCYSTVAAAMLGLKFIRIDTAAATAVLPEGGWFAAAKSRQKKRSTNEQAEVQTNKTQKKRKAGGS